MTRLFHRMAQPYTLAPWALPGGERDDGKGRLAQLLEKAESARRSGRLAEARSQFIQAAARAEAESDGPGLVASALGVGGLWVHEHRDVLARAQVHALWEKAELQVVSGSLEQARLAVRLATEAVYEGAPVDPVEAAVEAVRAFGEDGATAEALSLSHHVHLGPRYPERRLAVAEEIVRLAARAGDPALALMGLCWRTVDLFLMGSSRAAQSLAELRDRAATDRCEAIAFIGDVLNAMVLARSGRLDEAEVAATAAAERGNRVGDPDAGAYFGAMIAVLRWWQGRACEVVQAVRETSTSPKLGLNDHVYVAADAVLSASVGDIDSAEEALSRLSDTGLTRLPDSSSWLTTVALVAEAAYLLGNADLAEEVGPLLAPHAHLPVMPSLAVVCLGSAERALGLVAAAAGRLDVAIHHLDASLGANRRLGNRPMATLTEHTLAAILSARGAPGDKPRAEQLSRRAEERAVSMGLVLPSPPDWLAARPLIVRSGGVPRTASLEPVPRGWRITVDQRASLLPGRVGLSYLAQLIENPGRDVDVVSLASWQGIDPYSGPDMVLDEEALRSYHRRARELTASLARSDLAPMKAARQREELAAIRSALRSSTGLGGRPRNFPDAHERARTAVRKALLRAVATITLAEPDFGHHVESSLATGATCRYDPRPGWIVTVPSRGLECQEPQRGSIGSLVVLTRS